MPVFAVHGICRPYGPFRTVGLLNRQRRSQDDPTGTNISSKTHLLAVGALQLPRFRATRSAPDGSRSTWTVLLTAIPSMRIYHEQSRLVNRARPFHAPYWSCRPPDTELRLRLRDLANERKRFGYRRLFVLPRQAGEASGINLIYRLDREGGLTVRKRRARRRAVGARVPILVEATERSLVARFCPRPVRLRPAAPYPDAWRRSQTPRSRDVGWRAN
jgi:hypothetical protein